MIATWIISGIIVLIVLFIWGLYNSLTTTKMRVSEAWSGIDVQLKRRTDLIPNLVETVKSYAKHEQGVYDKILEARKSLMAGGGPAQQAQANKVLTDALKSLFALAESNPELKASENFKQLQEELSDVEAKIAYARQFYNSNVLDFNTKIKVFPNVLLAGSLGFKETEFFEAEEEEKKKPEVKF